MKVKIKDIKIGDRIRKDIGDIETLKNSIQAYGLIQPITIDEDYNLIAGFRRLTATKMLGEEEIEANIYIIRRDADAAGRLRRHIEANN